MGRELSEREVASFLAVVGASSAVPVGAGPIDWAEVDAVARRVAPDLVILNRFLGLGDDVG